MTESTTSTSRKQSASAVGLIVICTAQFLVALDLSIANIAIPSIESDLGVTPAATSWILAAFAVTFASTLLIGGRIADLHGRRRVFLASLALLGLASLLAGLAWNGPALIVGRVLQGASAGFIAPSALGLLTATTPEGPARERALGIFGAIMSAGFVSGMVGGGILTELASWRWTILINVPAVLIVVPLAKLALPESKVRNPQRLDLAGAVLSGTAMVSLLIALSAAGERHWLLAAGLLALGGCIAYGFIRFERDRYQPLLPLRLFNTAAVGWSNLIGFTMVAAYGGMLFVATLYLQQGLGLGPLSTGMALGAAGIVGMTTSVLLGRLMHRWRETRLLLFGIVVAITGLAILIFLPSDAGVWVVVLGTVVNAFGHIIVLVVVSVLANSGVPDDDKAVAGGLLNVAQQLGIAVGVALVTMVAVLVSSHVANNDPVLGWRWAIAVCTLLATLALAVVPQVKRRLDHIENGNRSNGEEA